MFKACFKGLFPFQNEPLPKQRFYFSSNSPICHTRASSITQNRDRQFSSGCFPFAQSNTIVVCMRSDHDLVPLEFSIDTLAHTQTKRRIEGLLSAACSLMLLSSVTRNKIWLLSFRSVEYHRCLHAL